MPEWRWLLWYYGLVLELPYLPLLALATWGRPVETIEYATYVVRLHNGQRHCLYAPAYISPNLVQWARDGLTHRANGAALYTWNGYVEWWVDDIWQRGKQRPIDSITDARQFVD